MNLKHRFEENLRKRASLKKKVESRLEEIKKISTLLTQTLGKGKKCLIFGNGGSAAQANHFATELVGRFKRERKGFRVLSLSTNLPLLTALSNDYGYEKVFSRQIEALGEREDVAIGISTSGNAPSVIEGIKKAKEKGMSTVGLTGKGGGILAREAEFILQVDFEETPLVQEAHLIILHLIAGFVEESLER